MKKGFTRVTFVLGVTVIGSTNMVFAEATLNSGCIIAGPEAGPAARPRDAAITIEEFADFECRFCSIASKTMRDLISTYPGKIKLVFRNMPLPLHKHSTLAAKAFSAVCMQSPDLADSYQKELFEHQDRLTREGEAFLYQTAEKLGVNLPQMKLDMNSGAVVKAISEDQKLAASHHFSGTPSFMIGSEPVTGSLPYDDYKKVIDKQLLH